MQETFVVDIFYKITSYQLRELLPPLSLDKSLNDFNVNLLCQKFSCYHLKPFIHTGRIQQCLYIELVFLYDKISYNIHAVI